jgi:hypothetical protein
MPKNRARHHAKTASPPKTPRRHGVVTRWEPGETFGLITDDNLGTWFVSRHPRLPELARGSTVTFAGSDLPPAGKRYPHARAVRLVAGAPGMSPGAPGARQTG